MRVFVASGVKELPKTPKLVLARDEAHGRRIMAGEGSDKHDARWLSHDFASMNDAPDDMAGVLDVPLSKSAKENVMEAAKDRA